MLRSSNYRVKWQMFRLEIWDVQKMVYYIVHHQVDEHVWRNHIFRFEYDECMICLVWFFVGTILRLTTDSMVDFFIVSSILDR